MLKRGDRQTDRQTHRHTGVSIELYPQLKITPKKVKRNSRGKDCIIFIADHSVKNGSDPEKTEVWFGGYNLKEIWESARPELTEAEKENKQLKILQREEKMIQKQLSKKRRQLEAVIKKDDERW